MATRDDDLADLALRWLRLPLKDRQYAVILLLDRGLAEFDHNLELKLVKFPPNPYPITTEREDA